MIDNQHEPASDKVGYTTQGIYFVQARSGSKLIKIGYSFNADRRIRDLQVGSPEPLLVLGVIPGTRKDERDWHERFHYLRQHGEWFDGYSAC